MKGRNTPFPRYLCKRVRLFIYLIHAGCDRPPLTLVRGAHELRLELFLLHNVHPVVHVGRGRRGVARRGPRRLGSSSHGLL